MYLASPPPIHANITKTTILQDTGLSSQGFLCPPDMMDKDSLLTTATLDIVTLCDFTQGPATSWLVKTAG